jgi:diguanylate cyclase (GGDEF)-like protein/PAS domain S-box-containing protein
LKRKIAYSSVAVCAAGFYWVLDAVVCSLLLHRGTFLQSVADSSPGILSRRLLAVVFILGAGLVLALRARARRVSPYGRSEDGKFRDLVENINDVVFSLDLEGCITYCNPVLERISGYKPAEVVGSSFASFVHPEDLPGLRRSMERTLAGAVEPHEFRVKDRQGKILYVRTSSRLFFQGGKPVGISGVMTDITALREREKRLRQLSRAVEENPCSIIITDAEGQIEYVNPKFTAVTGYEADEVLGRNPRLLAATNLGREDYEELWKQILSGRTWRGEFHNRKKSGELYWEWASISPVRDESGKITHFVAVKEDITERKFSDEALRESEEKYRMLFSNEFSAVALSSEESGRFIDVNAPFVKLFGYTADELTLMHVEDIFAPPSQVPTQPRLRPAGAPQKTPVQWCRKKDGTVFPVEMSRGTFPWKGGTMVCAVFADMSDRLRWEQAMEELSSLDALTGLANRRVFDEWLEREWNRAVRKGESLALIMVDVDHFKAFNDTHGHQRGDDCLRLVADALKACTRRSGDLVARYGGEEFVVILPETRSGGAREVAEAMRAAVEEVTVDGKQPAVTVSLGVSCQKASEGPHPATLIDAADRALYKAKELGGNRVAVSGPHPEPRKQVR